MTNYIIATVKPWNIDAYERHVSKLPGEWRLIDNRGDLTVERLKELNPRYIFFPHWSWKVRSEILKTTECVAFHMTDLPYGRGGSPLQNLISRGHDETLVSAIRMTPEVDEGPIYLKEKVSLDGRAEDIFVRLADVIYGMIKEIVDKEPKPVPQSGKPVMFERRTPDQSVLPDQGEIRKIYDHIRMLDAETYPHAFLDHGRFHLEFRDAGIGPDGAVTAKVEICKKVKEA